MISRSLLSILLLLLIPNLGLFACHSSPPDLHRHTVDLTIKHQVIDNFGASDCWSMQKIGTWSDKNRNRIADLLFSTEEGIGLSCWRFNLGGGICNESVTNPWRTIETFEVAQGQYDWTRQPGSRWFLGAAKARGVRQFIAFVNSPPRRMTRNGLTNCWGGVGTTNLKDGFEDQYAMYLVDILKHFRDNPDRRERINFNWVDPVNEPQYEWNGPTHQEGNRASNDDIKRIIGAIFWELKRQNLDAGILAPESGNIYGMHQRDGSWYNMMNRYGAEYGDYIWRFCTDPLMQEPMRKTICYHSYGTEWPGALTDQRREIRRETDWLASDWKLWMTEYCNLINGRDLGMWMALHVSRVIHYDLTLAEASAWQWWLAVSPGDYQDGLIYTNWQNPGDEESIIPSKTFWALGNYSRFIRPGMRRVEISGENDDPEGLLPSAFEDERTGRVVIVYVNRTSSPINVKLSFKGADKFFTFTPYVTSDLEGEDLRRHASFWPGRVYTVPERSVVTLVSGVGLFHLLYSIGQFLLLAMIILAGIRFGPHLYGKLMKWKRERDFKNLGEFVPVEEKEETDT